MAIIKTLYYLLKLKLHQRFNLEKLEKIQNEKLKNLIHYSYNNVPYYRKLFNDNNISPRDIRTKNDLKKIPITKKEDVQENYESIISKKKLRKKHEIIFTSGSTGKPLKILTTKKEIDYNNALILYVALEQGRSLLDKTIRFHIPEPNTKKSLLSKFGIFKRYDLDISDTLEDVVREYIKISPKHIASSPSFLIEFITYLQENNIKIKKPRTISLHGEVITLIERRKLTKFFGNKIFNIYGAAEVSRIAFECEKHNGLHIITDGCIVEFLDSEGNEIESNKEGHIVITNLYNYAMPLIRYDLGDLGIPISKRCYCGRTWPLLKQLTGRKDDIFILPNNRKISPNRIPSWHLRSLNGIKQFEIIQEKKDKILINIIKSQKFNNKSKIKLEKAKKALMSFFGPALEIKINITSGVPKKTDYKKRSIISKVKK